MEPMLQWLCEHGDNAPFLIFALLMLAGFSLPISEDLMLIASGVIASTVLPDHVVQLFLAVFFGCYFSDWIAYWIGRFFGKKLYKAKWFSHPKNETRLRRFHGFLEKYGFLALFVGRFIPFGIRNGIFMTAGAGKMHFGKFAISDGVACFLFSALVFSLAYYFGKNYDTLYYYMHKGGVVLLVLLFLVGLFFIIFYGVKKRQNRQPVQTVEPKEPVKILLP